MAAACKKNAGRRLLTVRFGAHPGIYIDAGAGKRHHNISKIEIIQQ